MGSWTPVPAAGAPAKIMSLSTKSRNHAKKKVQTSEQRGNSTSLHACQVLCSQHCPAEAREPGKLTYVHHVCTMPLRMLLLAPFKQVELNAHGELCPSIPLPLPAMPNPPTRPSSLSKFRRRKLLKMERLPTLQRVRRGRGRGKERSPRGDGYRARRAH